jgi:hypothetical protein
MSVESGGGDIGPQVGGIDRPDGGGPAAGPAHEAVEPTPEELTLELARAEAERDAAVAALDQRGRRERRRARARRIVVGVLVVLFAILLPLTYVVTWAHRVVLTTSGFEKTVVPIGTDPAVTSAAAVAITNQIFTSLNPQQIVANALPPKAAFLAGPVTNAAKGYVQDAVTKSLQSSQFQVLWKQAVDFAHAQLLSVLNGNSKAVTTTNGQVVLNLVPLLNSALQSLEGFIAGVVGHPVNLPTISGNELPSTVCQRISTALNRPVPATCGQIPLFPADKLTQARHAVRLFNGIVVLLLILTPVVAILALWLSRRRRRTLLQLCVGGLLGLVVIRRVVNLLTNSLVDTGVPANKSARRAILSHLFHQYFSISRWLVLGIIIVFLAALISGPYPWAISLRRLAAHYGREGWNLVQAIGGRARDDSTAAWVRSHVDLLRVLGVGVAVLLIIILPISWIGFLVIAVLLAAYQWWLYRLKQTIPAPDGATSTSSSTPPDDQPPQVSQPGPAQAV